MEDMKLLKAHHNTISFSEIEKHQFKHKRELSLPPIGNSLHNQSVIESPKKSSSIAADLASVNERQLSPSKKPDMIDEIHKLRLHIH